MDYGGDVVIVVLLVYLYCLVYILVEVLGFCSLLLMKDRYLFLNTRYALVWSTMMT